MRNARGKPFLVRNTQGRGRPKGSPNKTTAIWQGLVGQYGEAVQRKCLALALQGDPTALRLCMERMVAPVRNPPVHLRLPSVDTQADIAKAMNAVLQAAARGQITPEQAETLSHVVETRRRVLETLELEARIKEAEDLAA
jgi:hypothetical protein